MSYAQGSLIDASDYNTLTGGTAASSTSNRLNTVWSTGSGSAGYGQTAVANVAVASTVTATQWASLINSLNSTLTHQSGSGSGISAPVAGNKIDYLSTLQTSINTAYTNRLTFASNSAVITNVSSLAAYAAWTSATTTSTLTRAFGARATFASADQARYFFNSGGRLKFNTSAVNNLGAASRSAAVVALFTNLGGIGLFASNTSAGRTGTGGTLGTNLTTTGYYQLTTGNVIHVSVTSTTTNYTTDTANITVKTNGLQGSNNDNGTTIDFWTNISSTSGGNAGGSFDDALDVTPTVTIDVSFPETTNLSNTWGAVTVTRL
jgi:hypothetical protein